ncbi:MAG: hypothetical protein ABL931_22770, partial [Usitatibacteraceae bacterium]
LKRRRKILLGLLLSAITVNLVFFYAETRSPIPSVYLESAFSIAVEDESLRNQKAITLNPDGTWQSATGEPVDLLDALIFALPNIDSVDYSVVVNANHPPTLGDTIRISRSLASNGICNFTYLKNEVAESNSPYQPPLTISNYTLTERSKLIRCQASADVEARHEVAKAELDGIVELRRAKSANK